MANIGFIGTGIMGLPMAENLQKAGHQLFFSELYKKHLNNF
jgi:2-hydroxy-3-oxopropionate reductase